MSNVFKNFPSVGELLESPPLKRLLDGARGHQVVGRVREFLDGVRGELQSAAADSVPAVSELAERVAQWISQERDLQLHVAVNATGTLLHPGLGRAPLAPAAAEAVAALAGSYCTLDVDPEVAAPIRRDLTVEPLLQRLTGAEAAMVVNNGASATLLALAAVAAPKEVLVSRGQLIETGSYRLTDMISASGARLREVGATNRTRIGQFREAATTEAGALIRVHCGEFSMAGECEQPTLSELVELARRRHLPLIDLLGAGSLIDTTPYGLPHEPVIAASIRGGADLVLLSGDKLLGGPQCGLILGRRGLIARLQKHPLARALRCGKLTLAALAATLRLYLEPQRLEQTLPVMQMLSTSLANLRHRAERLAPQLEACGSVAEAAAVEQQTRLGAALPLQQIPTWCVAVTPAEADAERLAERLRGGTPSVWTRVHNGRLLLDLRTVHPSQDELLAAAFRELS